MNNYLIALFKQNNEIEFHTLAADNIQYALDYARSMVKMMHQIEFDSTLTCNGTTKYSNVGISVSEI